MNYKKTLIVGLSTAVVLAVFAQICFAFLLLAEDKALEQMFPDADKIERVDHTLSDAEVNAIKARLDGNLVHYQAGSQSENVAEQFTYTFFVGKKGGQAQQVAIVEEQPGKWGPVKFIISVDIATAKVNNLAVMEYKEKRGRPIARRNFLDQFVGKSSADPISVSSGKGTQKDIRAVSGATISSDCTCFAVKKVIALYEEVYQKNLAVNN